MSDYLLRGQSVIGPDVATSSHCNLPYKSLVLLVVVLDVAFVKGVRHDSDRQPSEIDNDDDDDDNDDDDDIRLTPYKLAIILTSIAVVVIVLVAAVLYCRRCCRKRERPITRYGFRYCNQCEQINTLSQHVPYLVCTCHQEQVGCTNHTCRPCTCNSVHRSSFPSPSAGPCVESSVEAQDDNSCSTPCGRVLALPHVNTQSLIKSVPKNRRGLHNTQNTQNNGGPNIETERQQNDLSARNAKTDHPLAQSSNRNWFKNIDPTLKDLLQVTKRSVTKQIGKKLVVFLTQEVDFNGQTLVLDNMGISLTVPYGAIPHGMKEYVSLVLNWDLTDNPDMSNDQSLVSPVVYCGPHGSTFKKKCELSFKHCAFNQKQIQVLTSETELTAPKKWTALSKSTKMESFSLTQDSCTVLMSHFSLYTCILYPLQFNPGKKWLQIAIFSNPLHQQINHYQFRIYFLNKTPCALQWAIQTEEKFGSRLCCPEKVFLFDGSPSDMCMTIAYLSEHWEQVDDSNIETVPFIQIWHGMCPHVCLCFKREGDTVSRELNMQLNFFQQNQTHEKEKMTVHMTEEAHQRPPLDDIVCKKHEFHFHFQGSNADYGSDIDAATTLHCIPFELRQRLSLLMNPQETFGNDWRMFASKLGFDGCIKYIQSQNNPMAVLLDRAECDGMSLGILHQILRDIERPDAAEEVRKFMDPHSTPVKMAIEN